MQTDFTTFTQGVFRTLSNIYAGDFWQKKFILLNIINLVQYIIFAIILVYYVNYICKKFPS